jgi:hypothetical protein
MTSCNESASYGKFKPANVKIGNVPRSSQKLNSEFTVTLGEHSQRYVGPNQISFLS